MIRTATTAVIITTIVTAVIITTIVAAVIIIARVAAVIVITSITPAATACTRSPLLLVNSGQNAQVNAQAVFKVGMVSVEGGDIELVKTEEIISLGVAHARTERLARRHVLLLDAVDPRGVLICILAAASCCPPNVHAICGLREKILLQLAKIALVARLALVCPFDATVAAAVLFELPPSRVENNDVVILDIPNQLGK